MASVQRELLTRRPSQPRGPGHVLTVDHGDGVALAELPEGASARAPTWCQGWFRGERSVEGRGLLWRLQLLSP